MKRRIYPPRLKRRRGGLGILSKAGLVIGMFGLQGFFNSSNDAIGIGWRVMAGLIMVVGFVAWIFSKE